MTADRHKHAPIRFRPSEANRERIAAYAEKTGKPVNAILNEALNAFWQVGARGPTAPPTGPETPVPAVGPRGMSDPAEQQRVLDDFTHREADGTPRKRTRTTTRASAAEKPAPRSTSARKLPCEHRVQPGAYCGRCDRLI